MRLFRIYIYLIFVFIFLGPTITLSSEEEHEQHDKHVHGKGELRLVLEKKELQMEFIIPAMSIVGFEHEANSEEDKQSVQKAVTDLENVNGIVRIPRAAQCTLQSSDANFRILGTEENEAHDDDEEHHEGEEEHHDDDEEHHGDEEDHHDDDEEHHEENGHSEFQSQYRFVCEKPEKIEMIEFFIFKAFERIEEIDVALIVSSKQSFQELTPQNAVIQIAECGFKIGSWCIF